MTNDGVTIRTYLKRHGRLNGSALETAVREWSETNTTWTTFTRSVRAGFVYPGADNHILCPDRSTRGQRKRS